MLVDRVELGGQEARLAAQMRRNLNTVRRTWFEFRLQNGVYEPVGMRFE